MTDDRPQWERDLEHGVVGMKLDEKHMPLEELVEEIRNLVFHAATLEPGSYAHEHFLATGHKLAFGCCTAHAHAA